MSINLNRLDKYYTKIRDSGLLPCKGKVILKKRKENVSLPKFIVEGRIKGNNKVLRRGINKREKAESEYQNLLECYYAVR